MAFFVYRRELGGKQVNVYHLETVGGVALKALFDASWARFHRFTPEPYPGRMVIGVSGICLAGPAAAWGMFEIFDEADDTGEEEDDGNINGCSGGADCNRSATSVLAA
ncbi:hypothetical protein [Pseudosulfitobacter koreensis]|uniref:hypothetical protein n=1 Tax=Pseudosulfitobacter koreensis TaxID=2968472 RepID=UPI00215A11CC|nr:hypothetical protein [Pseudosulfitobacter koreense]